MPPPTAEVPNPQPAALVRKFAYRPDQVSRCLQLPQPPVENPYRSCEANTCSGQGYAPIHELEDAAAAEQVCGPAPRGCWLREPCPPPPPPPP